MKNQQHRQQQVVAVAAVAAVGGDDRNKQIQDFKDLTLSIPLQQTALLFELIDKINNPPPPPPAGGGVVRGGSIESLIAQNPGLKAALQIEESSGT